MTRLYAEAVDDRTARAAEPLRPEAVLLRIDRVLQQGAALGRREGSTHVACARFGNTVVVLADNDRDYDWLLPAIRQRLREELAALKLEFDPEQTLAVDLAHSEKLQLFGLELRSVRDKHGNVRIEYRRIAASDRGRLKLGLPGRGLQRVLGFVRRALHCFSPSERYRTAFADLGGVARDSLTHPLAIPFGRGIISLSKTLLQEWRWLAPLLALQIGLACIYLIGGSLAGTVSYQGMPVQRGQVVLLPADAPITRKTPRILAPVVKGKYKVSGLEPGLYSVTVLTPELRTMEQLTVDVGYLWNTRDLDLEKMAASKQ